MFPLQHNFLLVFIPLVYTQPLTQQRRQKFNLAPKQRATEVLAPEKQQATDGDRSESRALANNVHVSCGHRPSVSRPKYTAISSVWRNESLAQRSMRAFTFASNTAKKLCSTYTVETLSELGRINGGNIVSIYSESEGIERRHSHHYGAAHSSGASSKQWRSS